MLTIKETGTKIAKGVPVTASLVFKKGEYRSVGAVLGDEVLPTQLNVLARHDDGSIRHCLLTFKIDTEGRPGQLHKVKIDPKRSAKAQTFPVPAMKDFGKLAMKVEVTDEDDNVWILDIPRAYGWPIVKTAVFGHKWSTGLQGGLAEELEMRAPLKSLTEEHPQLSAVFRWKLFNGWDGARLEVVLENAAFPAMADVQTRSIKVQMGEETVLSLDNAMVYAGQRFRHVSWVGEEAPELLVQQDPAYLRELGAIPLLDTDKPIDAGGVQAMVGNYIDNYDANEWPDGPPLQSVVMMSRMGSTGDRPDIGALPRWAIATVNSLEQAARDVQRAADGNSAGAFPVHMRDANGRMGITRNAKVDRARGKNKCPYTPDVAHQPSLAYVSYLLTGETYYMEELAAWSSYCTRRWPWGRELPGTGDRMEAWSLRTVTHAAWILPDKHHLKEYLVSTIEWNLDDWMSWVMDEKERPLHTWDLGTNHSSGRKSWPVGQWVSPWQYAWLIWALYNCWRLFDDERALTLFRWSCQYLQKAHQPATFTAKDGTVIEWDPAYADQYSLPVAKFTPYIDDKDRLKVSDLKPIDNFAEALWYLHVNTKHQFSKELPAFPEAGPEPENWTADDFRKDPSGFEEYAFAELVPAMVWAGIEGSEDIWKYVEPHVNKKLRAPGMKQVPRLASEGVGR